MHGLVLVRKKRSLMVFLPIKSSNHKRYSNELQPNPILSASPVIHSITQNNTNPLPTNSLSTSTPKQASHSPSSPPSPTHPPPRAPPTPAVKLHHKLATLSFELTPNARMAGAGVEDVFRVGEVDPILFEELY